MLRAPQTLSVRLRPPAAATAAPSLESELAVVTQTELQSSDGTTSEEEGPGGRVRTLQSRAQRRRQLLEAHRLEPTLGGASFLERSAVRLVTERRYRAAVETFLQWADSRGLALVEDAAVDEAVVQYMTDSYAAGLQAHVGEVLAAGLIHFLPAYGRLGCRRLPRMWKALKGWRLRTPSRSRVPFPFPVWAGVVWELCRMDQWLMATYVLFMLVTYCRPSELLQARRSQLVPPVAGATTAWAVLLFPEEAGRRSKTQVFDEGISLLNHIVPWLPKLAEVLAQGQADERIFPFDYGTCVASFRRAAAAAGVPGLVPYQARHSGASIDRAQRHRSILEVKQRGRWRADASLIRYEKSARLARALSRLTPAVQARLHQCALALEGLFFGRAAVGSILA